MRQFKNPLAALAFRKLMVAVLLASVGSPMPVRAQSSEQLCNEVIVKAAVKLRGMGLGAVTKCIRNPAFRCGFGNQYTAALLTIDEKVDSPDSPCFAAVNTDGVPVSAFGPLTCPREANGWCDPAPGSLLTLTDLGRCLYCQEVGLVDKYEFDLDLPEQPASSDDKKCILQAQRATRAAILTALKAVGRCARGGVKPFACPVDDADGTQFGKALGKISTKVGKCRNIDATGKFVGETANLGHCASKTPAGLTRCLTSIAKCHACRLSNTMLGQAQDCADFSGDRLCTGDYSAPDGVYVTNGDDDTITYFTDDGSYISGDLAGSSFATGSQPSAVAANPLTNVVYVANAADGSVTYLDGATGEHVGGSLALATIGVGANPSAVGVDARQGIVYVANEADDSVTFLDARTPAYAFGSLAASTFPVGTSPRALAVNEVDRTLAVANFADGTVTYLLSDTGDYVGGSLAAATLSVGAGPSSIGLALGRFGVPRFAVTAALDGTFVVLDGATPQPALGTVANSTVGAGSDPRLLAGDAGVFVVVDRSAGTLAAYDARYGRRQYSVPASVSPSSIGIGENFYVTDDASDTLTLYRRGDSRALSSLPSHQSMDLAINSAGTILYSVSDIYNAVQFIDLATSTVFQETFLVWGSDVTYNPSTEIVYGGSGEGSGAVVTYLDAATGAFLNGTSLNSQIRPHYVSDLAVNPGADLLYVARTEGDVRFYDASDVSAPPSADVPIGSYVSAVAVHPALNRLYAASRADGHVVILDATTGAYLNGTLSASSIPTGGTPVGLAVNETDDILYVANREGTIVYLDALDGTFLYGTLAASTFGALPSAEILTVDPSTARLYVSSQMHGIVVALNAITGSYVGGTLERSAVAMEDGTIFADGPERLPLVLDTGNGRLYVGSSRGHDVVVLEAATLDYAIQETALALATVATGSAPSAVAAMPE